MSMSLAELAALVGGRVQGDGATPVTGAATIRDARVGDITLADSPKFAGLLADCPAVAVVIPTALDGVTKPAIVASDVHAAFARIVAQFRPRYAAAAAEVSAGALVSPKARLAPDVTVHAGATIEEDVEIGAGTVVHAGVRILPGCRIGPGCTLFPNVVLYENTRLGARVILHAGAVLGAYGFGYATKGGRHLLSPQLGNVEVGDDVEIGAGTTVDRGTYGPTVIGEGTKIDNQVMIAHNCRIGRHNMICSQVGVAGSCTTGDYVVMAGQVGVRDHVNIGDRVMIGAKSGVMTDLPAGQQYLGAPAVVEREEMRLVAAIHKLPELRKEVRELRRILDELQALRAAAPASKPQGDAA